MSYRKLVVNGKQYEYVVGKNFTKVKGFEAVPNEEIGSLVKVYIHPCYKKCGCEPMSYTYNRQVKPKDVAKFIETYEKDLYPKPNEEIYVDKKLGKVYKSG